jgi:hypothetical protein
MTTNPDLVCMEDHTHNVTRWFRIAQQNQTLHVIESTSYAAVDHAYFMQFDNQEEFDRWLDYQQQEGWHVTFTHDQNFESFDPVVLAQVKSNVFRTLKQGN